MKTHEPKTAASKSFFASWYSLPASLRCEHIWSVFSLMTLEILSWMDRGGRGKRIFFVFSIPSSVCFVACALLYRATCFWPNVLLNKYTKSKGSTSVKFNRSKSTWLSYANPTYSSEAIKLARPKVPSPVELTRMSFFFVSRSLGMLASHALLTFFAYLKSISFFLLHFWLRMIAPSCLQYSGLFPLWISSSQLGHDSKECALYFSNEYGKLRAILS